MTLSLQSVPVISHSRWLLKKGEVQQMAGPKSTRTMRSKKLHHPVYLFLFNNLLLITKRSSRSAHDIITQRQLVVIGGRSAHPLSVWDFLLPPQHIILYTGSFEIYYLPNCPLSHEALYMCVSSSVVRSSRCWTRARGPC